MMRQFLFGTVLACAAIGGAAVIEAQPVPPSVGTPSEGTATEQAPKIAPDLAAEDDRGFVTRFLEEKLSGAGRTVVLEGFHGALSSRATFDKLTIADDQGVWITLNKGAIQWTRSALLLGRVEIAELSAQEILLPRRPVSSEDGTTPEAVEFRLPDLPVAVNIEKISAARVDIGAPVFGEAAVVSADGSMSLSGGEGVTHLKIDRVDGKRGQFTLEGSYSNATKVLDFNLALDEDRGGIVANMLNLPDRPALAATIVGTGPVSDYSADIVLASDGQPRVQGAIKVKEELREGAKGHAFSLDLGGDVSPLVSPQMRDFFGSSAKIVAQGWRGINGAVQVPELSVSTDALKASGVFETAVNGAPERAHLTIALGRAAGAKVVPSPVPILGLSSRLEDGQIELTYDRRQGDGWTLKGELSRLLRDDVNVDKIVLNGAGQVVLAGAQTQSINGSVSIDADGIGAHDPALARAVGRHLGLRTDFDLREGNALQFEQVSITGDDYGLSGDLAVDGLRSALTVSGTLEARYDDVARLSGLAGRPLGGRATAEITGLYTLLSGAFDTEIAISGQDMTVGQPQLDGMLRGTSDILLSARRDEDGFELRDLTIDGRGILGKAQGTLTRDASTLQAEITAPDLSQMERSMSGSAKVTAFVSGPIHARRLTVSGDAQSLRTGIAAIDGAFKGKTALSAIVQQTGDRYDVQTFRLANPQVTLNGQGDFGAGQMQGRMQAAMGDLAVLGQGWRGGFDADVRLAQTPDGHEVVVDGTGHDLAFGPVSKGQATGETTLSLRAREQAGIWQIDAADLKNDQMQATAQGVIGKENADAKAKVMVKTLAPFGRGWSGALNLDAVYANDASGQPRLSVKGKGHDLSFGQQQLGAALRGETVLDVEAVERDGTFVIQTAKVSNPRLNATADGQFGGGRTDLRADLRATDLGFLGRGFGGSVNAKGRVTEKDGARRIVADGVAQSLTLGMAQVDALLRGQTRFDLDVSQRDQAVELHKVHAENPQLRIDASGQMNGNTRQVILDARLNDAGLLDPSLSGAATAKGRLSDLGGRYGVDLTLGGLRTDAKITGTAARDFKTMDLAIAGQTDSALANPFLRTRSLSGPVRFDLRLKGRPAVESLSGQVRLSGARMADPGLGIALSDLSVTTDLGGGRATISGQGAVQGGGRVRAQGFVTLTGARPVDLRINLDNVNIRDPNLYETTASGELRMSGALANGALIAGQINLSETEVRIPSTGLGSAKDIPKIIHTHDRPPVRATRAKAGLAPYPGPDSKAAGMAAPPATPGTKPMRLDILISSPNRVFVRGRGVDAEMGGELRLTGTSRKVVPIGHLGLIRGRVDLLGKRFVLSQGTVEMQGSFVPVIRLVAVTEQNGITTSITIDGEASDPEITFGSSPELPQEEVLSQLIFGRGLDKISPLQAAQLANAVAVLAGRGGEGIIGSLRKQVGLDDLDLATDSEGNVSVRAGKYISEKVYTDVQVGADGKSQLNLNLDITPDLTARGSVDSKGDSSIGLFYEKDY